MDRYSEDDEYFAIVGFGDRGDLVSKGEVFIKYEAEVSSRLSGVK